MSNEYKDYGLEDICESLDAIETQMKELISLLKKSVLFINTREGDI